MHDYKIAELKARIEATNKAHAEYHRIRPLLVAALQPLIGQKVRKVDGTLIAEAASDVNNAESEGIGDK